MADKAVLSNVKSMNDSLIFNASSMQSSEHRVRPIKLSSAAPLRGSPRPIHLVRHPVGPWGDTAQSAPALSKMKLN
jgi:hypothetical protein